MGYTVTSDTKLITWNDNPSGGQTFAKIENGSILELVVQNSSGASVIYTTDQDLLLHVRTVIDQLLSEVNA